MKGKCWDEINKIEFGHTIFLLCRVKYEDVSVVM